MTQAIDLANAINSFVVGCKQDGIWDPIKACCIMAAWDGLNGALYPLKGTAPTNNNFVSGDYNRETGLVGDGSTKYLDSNRNNNADPQDSKHMSAYASELGVNFESYVGIASVNGSSHLSANITTNGIGCRINSNGGSSNTIHSVGLQAANRSNSTTVSLRSGGVTTGNLSQASSSPASANMLVFSGAAPFSTGRLAFYSIGESLDLAKLDTRVSDLITAIGAAIP